jgi:F0F1-type ATP synthase assembly protein I
MSKPARLNHPELAKALLLRLLSAGLLVAVLGYLLAPEHAVFVVYGVLVFLASNAVFALYVFRYSGSRSSVLMLRSFARGVMFKIILFALSLLVVYRFDERSMGLAQSATILVTYFLMQLFQLGFSAGLARKFEASFLD